MIDRRHIGRVLPSGTVEVEKGKLRFFAKAIGENNPIYTDEAVAQAAGYSSLPAPPTFLFSLENEALDPANFLGVLGVDLCDVLHGEQSFIYRAPVEAGDTLTFEPRIADIYDRKNGALEFVVRETTIRNQVGTVVATSRTTIVINNGRRALP